MNDKKKFKKQNNIIKKKSNQNSHNNRKLSKRLKIKQINIKDKFTNLKEEKNISHKQINISEEEEENNIEKNINIKESKGISSDKETNSTDNRQHLNEDENNKKKEKKLLGKKRRLKSYKMHSLSYNELYELYDEKEIDLNINSLFSCTIINPSKIKGNFIGLLETKEKNKYYDFVIELISQNDGNYNNIVIYSSKTFQKKLSFLENSKGTFYLLYKGYAAYLYNDSIKIYFFSNDNTQYDIFQKIVLDVEYHNAILFLFKFIHNDNFYFFYKIFGLKKDNEITLYKFNKDEQNDENDYAVRGRTFIEDEILKLDFEFIWFSQKNNNELLFFYEVEFVFRLNCYDLSTKSITQRKVFKLNNIKQIKIAQYADNVINKRFLVLSNHNLLYIIDSYTWQITVIKESDVIEYFKVFNDNTLWTVESCEKTLTIENNKKRNISLMFVRQYKINVETHEIIKIGERRLYKNYLFINNIIQISKKKVLLFVEVKKLVLLN